MLYGFLPLFAICLYVDMNTVFVTLFVSLSDRQFRYFSLFIFKLVTLLFGGFLSSSWPFFLLAFPIQVIGALSGEESGDDPLLSCVFLFL